jgi:plasmid maintenance system antidote protein VapI
MTSAELRAIGEKLYGAQWQTKMAKALPISTRSINNWLNDVHRITERTARQIRALRPENEA